MESKQCLFLGPTICWSNKLWEQNQNSGNIEIFRSGSYVTAFSSECNIRVQFDGNHLVSVKVERDYFGGNLTGICGNCNGNYHDDLQTKDGKDVSSSGRRGHSDIGNSYKVFDDADEPDSRLVQI
jgi:hypothetical protein